MGRPIKRTRPEKSGCMVTLEVTIFSHTVHYHKYLILNMLPNHAFSFKEKPPHQNKPLSVSIALHCILYQKPIHICLQPFRLMRINQEQRVCAAIVTH